ncbi:MAG: Glycosyl transferase, group 1 [Parcubacteria group bacterium Gr01-1014_18]|nr:MAG: Glycosyl transferase, group 1 [Parcubacteria group bacterium Greene0416_36]TSC81106.1 MAG: Glycosyl transferase, group 1 [Parcubacteria group bacterium Gr01-1014_18]TSC98478.1 MAG: Glycosyl transferase, group 1 [Parcubacteria group bacterium Greene1014_20]TSD07357.1 MAG: Glycosyl transferase, group 1 [Parcubacteria group bacterium Greene0714_2]
MTIGIDARFYGTLGKGLGRYTQRLIEYIEPLDRENQYVIFLRRENWEEYTPRFSNFRKVLAPYSWYGFSEQIFFPFLIWKEGIDLMHFPHFNVPILCPAPLVVTIHDLILLDFPTPRATALGPVIYKIKEAVYHIVIRMAIWRAKRVITISEYTKKRLMAYFRRSENKIAVIYQSGRVNICQEGPGRASGKNDSSRDIIRPYFLYVGNAYPHKNLEGLLRAYKVFVHKNGFTHQLVLVGKMDYFYEGVKKLAGELGLLESPDGVSPVIFRGQVSDCELCFIYRSAFCYVFPSFVEGFGLPPLEAMNYGIPVLSSNRSCLPEILGDGALFFDPGNEAEFVESLIRISQDDLLRTDLVEKGYRTTQKYSWEKFARETLGVYQKEIPPQPSL